MRERDEFFDMLEAFDLLPAIEAVVSCRSILALGALEKVIDCRIKDLEQVIDLVEQTREKTEQKVPFFEQKTQKTERRRDLQGIYGRDQILKECGTTKIYKPVLNSILRETKELFTLRDVSRIITKHYKEALKREITEGSAGTYAFNYVKYMVSEKIIIITGDTEKEGIGRAYIQYRKQRNKSVEEKEKELGIINGTKNKDKTANFIKEKRQFEEDVCDGTKDMF